MSGPIAAAGLDEVRARITGLWRELLGNDTITIGPHDNFFALGASSLQGLTLAQRLRDEFGVAVSLLAVAEKPTVAELSEHVLARLAEGPLEEGEI